MRIILIITVWYALICADLHSEKKKINRSALTSIVSTLSSKKFEGRKSGLRGGNLAQEYIISFLKKNKVRPGGIKNTYIQDINFRLFNIISSEFCIKKENVLYRLEYGADYIIMKNSGSSEINGQVKITDTKNIKSSLIKDQTTALIIRDSENLTEPFDLNSFADKHLCTTNIKTVILASKRSVKTLNSDFYKKNISVLLIKENIFQWIINSDKINQNSERSIPGSVHVKIRTRTIMDKKRKSRNIFALIPGKSDNPGIILAGAHYDHLGMDTKKRVIPGADDNASGTAALMETARALRSEYFPNTILFAFWGAEEQNIKGSEFFLKHPFIDTNKILAYINVDMIGQGNNKLKISQSSSASILKKFLINSLNKKDLNRIEWYERIKRNGDHWNFIQHSIPSFNIQTAGIHYNYHTILDNAQNIDKDVLFNASELILRIISSLGHYSRTSENN